MSKIIICNYNLTQSILNFFDVYTSLPGNEFKSHDELELPRVIGSNESFEQMEDSEATWYINDKVNRQGFYLEEGLNIARYYNPKIYPEN